MDLGTIWRSCWLEWCISLNEVVSLFTSSDLNEILSTSCPLAYTCYSSNGKQAQLCGLQPYLEDLKHAAGQVRQCSSTFTVHCHILKICIFFGYQQYRSDQKWQPVERRISGWRSWLIQIVLVQNKLSANRVWRRSNIYVLSMWKGSKFSRIIQSEIIVHVLWMGNTCCRCCFPILCKLHMTDWLR